MSSRRSWAVRAILLGTLLATGLVGTGSAHASPTIPSSRKAPGGDHHLTPAERAARAAAALGVPPRNYVIPQGSFFSFPNRGKAEAKAIRQRVLGHDPERLGRSARPGHPRLRRRRRHDPDRHLVLRRLGCRQGPGGRPQPRGERAGGRGRRQEQAHGSVALPAQEAQGAPVPRRPPRARGPDQLRPGLPRLLPRSWRYGAREVLPLRQRRCHPAARRRGEHLDEPDQFALREPVEPGQVCALAVDLQRLPRPSSARRGHDHGVAAYHVNETRQRRRRLLLPVAGATAGRRPGDAGCSIRSAAPAPPPVATAAVAPGSGSSSTPSTATAASGSPSDCVSCGTPAATSGSSTPSPAARCSASCATSHGRAPSRCASR